MKKEPSIWDILGAAVMGAILAGFLMWAGADYLLSGGKHLLLGKAMVHKATPKPDSSIMSAFNGGAAEAPPPDGRDSVKSTAVWIGNLS